MKIGIISDIEGNHENLVTVLRMLEDCRYIVNLGDTVGDKGDSDAVIASLKDDAIKSVAGNHDLELVLGKSVPADKFLSDLLSDANEIVHPKISLNSDSIAFLQKLKMSLTVKLENRVIACCHSLYGYNNDTLFYEYVNTDNADKLIGRYNRDIVFVGHSHIPAIIALKNNHPPQMVNVKKTVLFKIEPNIKYIINPGSVGAPRQKGMNLSYAVLDTDNGSLSLELM